MSETVKSWIKENGTLLGFLMLQAIAIVAYAVRLETRVNIIETRGSEFTVNREDRMAERITVLEQQIDTNKKIIERVVTVMTKELHINPVSDGGKP